MGVKVSRVRLPYADVRGLGKRGSVSAGKIKDSPLVKDGLFLLGISSTVQSTAFRSAP